MSRDNPQLRDLIRRKIEQSGPVTFAWFMQHALYQPDHGYYSSGRAKLGRRGDYFTNVSVGPMFGRLLAFQFVEIWEQLGRPAKFIIVEQGAHEGRFAGDAMQALSAISPECFAALRYNIIEPFPVVRDLQRQALSEFGNQIEWHSSLDAIEPFVGIHFSNELLDSMPVHLVRRVNREAQWMEKFVNCDNERFVFTEKPVRDERIAEQLEAFAGLPGEIEIEINLAALDWIFLLSQKLEQGCALTIDYGFVTPDLSTAQHQAGTLRCRHRHRVIDSPFHLIGNCDITAHVSWTSVSRHAEKHNFSIDGFTDQHHFLTGIIESYPAALQTDNANARRQLQTLLHPEMMGRSFQVLALSQGRARGLELSGFKFARPPRQELGLCLL